MTVPDGNGIGMFGGRVRRVTVTVDGPASTLYGP